MLTGIAAIGFAKWLIKNNKDIISVQDIGFKQTLSIVDVFRLLPFNMQFSVYVDYIDSVGFKIELSELDNKWIYFINYNSFDVAWQIPTRNEARIQAIEKANEIINNK